MYMQNIQFKAVNADARAPSAKRLRNLTCLYYLFVYCDCVMFFCFDNIGLNRKIVCLEYWSCLYTICKY